MRLEVWAVLVLAGCGAPPAPAADAGPTPDREGIVAVADGRYEIEWVTDTGLGLGGCDRLELAGQTTELTMLAGEEICAGPFEGQRRSTCACFPPPVEGTRGWCLCPGVGRLLGEILYTDSSAAASLFGFPR
jgi:hypothetical protein